MPVSVDGSATEAKGVNRLDHTLSVRMGYVHRVVLARKVCCRPTPLLHSSA